VQHTIGQEIKWVLAFVAAIWAVFLIGRVVPYDVNAFGLTPRTTSGLYGIFAMPFLHANFAHLTANTLPLLVLLMLLAGSKTNSWQVVVAIIVLGGVLLWLFGRHATHIGASGLVFGLMSFLIVSGLVERRIVPLLIAVLVGFLYGGSMLAGIVPHLGSNVSWDGHLFGAIAGGVVAVLLEKHAARRSKVMDG
jgi:membrane associated rhomboid family serine protease